MCIRDRYMGPKLEERVGPSLYDMGEKYKRERDFAQLHKPQAETKWVFEEAPAPPEAKSSNPIKERVVSKSELYAKMFPQKEVKKDDDDDFDLNKLNEDFQQSSEGLPSVLNGRKRISLSFLNSNMSDFTSQILFRALRLILHTITCDKRAVAFL
eukprot:TRINITY_DN1353_c0_g1_i15.p1 TRINITY_DN1353_c0_g1~~TRINITY_DN1353_c0_g1_i15.p1  ORF type:complete len:155 (+),score=15.77 TRINITY_DN1353_c0_g1_i15:169-633(+)